MFVPSAYNRDANQPARVRRLISVFVGLVLDNIQDTMAVSSIKKRQRVDYSRNNMRNSMDAIGKQQWRRPIPNALQLANSDIVWFPPLIPIKLSW